MSPRAQVFVALLALVGLAVIVVLVRRGRLRERMALMWLGIGLGMVVLVAVRPWLDRLSELLGIRSGTTTLFLLSTVFLLGLILHLSVLVSGLEEKVRRLAQELALLRSDREERP